MKGFWSGKGSDIFESVERAFTMCDVMDYSLLYYDADGVGADVRGNARILNEKRTHEIEVLPFHGSGKIVDPEGDPFARDDDSINRGSGRTNEDYFANRKAQSWWYLRTKFKNTYRAVVEGMEYNPNEIISISSKIPNLSAIMAELSQPTYGQNGIGKLLINKTPEGGRSPNYADSIMIAFAPQERATPGLLLW